MAQYVANVPVKFKTTSVTVAASPVYYDTQNHPFPLTVVAVPGAAGTMAVAYSVDENASALGASATWIDWPSGAVAANTADTLISPVAGLRFTATVSTGSVKVAG